MTANDFKTMRQALGLSQIEMADALGVKQPLISLWEAGKREIPVYIVKLIEAKFVSALDKAGGGE